MGWLDVFSRVFAHLSRFNMCELRVHAVTRRVARNLTDLFPGKSLLEPPHVVVTLALQTTHRQTAMTEEMLEERERCFKSLVTRMTAFHEHLSSAGFWCDFIDPATGAPFHSDSAATLLECDELYRNFGFEILELGCCRALANRSFGQCLVATAAFTSASEEFVTAAFPLLERDPVPESV